MCLAIPGKVKTITDKTATVDFGGVSKSIRVDLLPNIKPDDYVLVHAGFGIGILNEEDAKKTIEAWQEIYGG